MKKQCVVAGAGLVGSLWAIYLSRMGHNVTVLEKRPDMRKNTLDGGRSINLIVTSRGIKALRDLGLWEEVKTITTPVYGRMMHALDARLTYQPYGTESECNFSVSRAELNCKLMDLAEREGVVIRFEQEILDINFKAREITLKNKEPTAYDSLFGCDGAGSAVRTAMSKKLTGFSNSVEWLGADYKELLMPASEQGKYVMDQKALHIWPRGSHMLMALPNQGGSFTMTVYLPENMAKNLDSKAKIQAHFHEYYHDASELIPDYLEQYETNPLGKLGTVRCYPWVYENSVALLGDAAHAIVPFFGQGMNAGFEDCTILNGALSRVGEDWTEAFEVYQKVQKSNADSIATMAIENYEEMKSKVGDQDFLKRKRIEHDLEELYPKLYKSRYGLITYTLVGYHHAQNIGQIQQEIISWIIDEDINELSDPRVPSKIEELLSPYLHEHHLSLARYH